MLSGLFELADDRRGRRRRRRRDDRSRPSLAFIVGYAAIAWLLRYLVDHSIRVFVAYRMTVGLLVIVLAATNVIS